MISASHLRRCTVDLCSSSESASGCTAALEMNARSRGRRNSSRSLRGHNVTTNSYQRLFTDPVCSFNFLSSCHFNSYICRHVLKKPQRCGHSSEVSSFHIENLLLIAFCQYANLLSNLNLFTLRCKYYLVTMMVYKKPLQVFFRLV